jgi:signal transduction histidine kinase
VIERWWRLTKAVLARPPVLDLLVFLLIALSMTFEFIGAQENRGLSPLRQKLWLFFAAVMVLAMLLRRLAPFTVLAVVALTFFALGLLLGIQWSPVTAEWCMAAGTYTVASRRSTRVAAAAVVLGSLSFIPAVFQARCFCPIFLFTWLSFAAIAGFSMQAGWKLMQELNRQAGVLKSTRQERLKLALEQERSRVARELHDVVAHAVTVMVVQAAAARLVASNDPLRADDALGRVESMAGQALLELDSLVGSLEPDAPGAAAPRPRPRVEDLPSLIEQERTAGLNLDLLVEGEPHSLHPAMDTSLYRIVQEALTNVRKHAPGAPAHVALRYLRQDVEIEVTNSAPQQTTLGSVPGFGRGLIGIRERAALFSGEASAEATPDGGFRVSARLPLELVPT